MKLLRSRIVALIAVVGLAATMIIMVTDQSSVAAGPSEADCRSLTGLDLEGLPDAPTVVASADPIAGDAELPAHCVVRSWTAGQVGVVIKLPLADDWTGRFLFVGCGGSCGYDPSASCDAGLAQGFATAGTDSGHAQTGDNVMLWAFRNPDALADWGHRSTHVATVAAKAITERFYRDKISFSYFGGCSTGGRQAMIQAQRYPDDFDGIMANSPGHDLAASLAVLWPWQSQVAYTGDGRPILNDDDIALVADAVLDQCDPSDGLADGLISRPERCRPDLSGLPLPPEKLTAVLGLYSVPKNKSGPIVSAGIPYGSEAYGDWNFLFSTTQMYDRTESLLRYAMYDPAPGPSFSVADWDPDDWPKKFRAFRRLAEATNTNLDRFRAGGGKLMITHGLADAFVVPAGSTDYYRGLIDRYGYRELTSFARLFTVPGAAHCSGTGELGPTEDSLAGLVAWVEQGTPPERLDVRYPLAPTDPAPPRTRPVFPYPYLSVYDGTGSIDDPENFRPVRP